MLIPRQPVDEEGNPIDPREELVQRLLEYKRYKSVLDELREMEERRSQQATRGNASRELRRIANQALADAELESLTLFKLLRAFENVMQRYEYSHPGQVHQIVQFNYSIEEQQRHILSKVINGQQANFQHIFGDCQNRIHAIVTFLAMLELLNMERLRILPGEGVNNFWLEAAA